MTSVAFLYLLLSSWSFFSDFEPRMFLEGPVLSCCSRCCWLMYWEQGLVWLKQCCYCVLACLCGTSSSILLRDLRGNSISFVGPESFTGGHTQLEFMWVEERALHFFFNLFLNVFCIAMCPVLRFSYYSYFIELSFLLVSYCVTVCNGVFMSYLLSAMIIWVTFLLLAVISHTTWFPELMRRPSLALLHLQGCKFFSAALFGSWKFQCGQYWLRTFIEEPFPCKCPHTCAVKPA